MAYSDYTFDPTGENAANLISQEIQVVDPAVTVAVFPDQGAFFSEGILVEGRKDAGTWEELIEGYHFAFSPLFLMAAAKSTRQRVFSYLVLMAPDVADIDEVRLTYQCIGQYQDDTLLAEIASQVFDRTDPLAWLNLQGQSSEFNPVVRDPDLRGVSLTEIIAQRIELMASAIADPYASNRNYGAAITELKVEVAKALSSTQLAQVLITPDVNKTVNAASNEILYTFKNDLVKASVAAHLAITGDGHDSLIVDISRGSSGYVYNVRDRLNSGTDYLSVSFSTVGNDVNVTAVMGAAGRLKVKTIYEF